MREILFRGKTESGKWVEGSLILAKNYCCILQDEEKIHEMDYPYLDGDLGTFDGQATPVIPETVGQFTGLTDKNGEKIFEGDIVDILTENEEIGVVAYDDGGFLVNADGFCVDFHSNINGTDLEVIGNIHDNPEFLKEGVDIG